MASAFPPEVLIAVISSQQISGALLFCSLSIAIYDHLLVLPAEIEKIWKAKWTLVKFIYVSNRITNWLILALTFANSFAVSLSSSFCKGSISFILIISIYSMMIRILLLRIVASYPKEATKILRTWFAITVVISVIITAMLVRDVIQYLVFVPVIRCIPTQPITHWGAFLNVPYLLFQITMFIALVWKYMQSPGREVGGVSRLLYAIFHNAVIYFLLICGISVIVMLIANFGPLASRQTVPLLGASMGTSALSRCILDLRTLNSRVISADGSEDMSLSTRASFSTHIFAYDHEGTGQSKVISSVGVKSSGSGSGIEP